MKDEEFRQIISRDLGEIVSACNLINGNIRAIKKLLTEKSKGRTFGDVLFDQVDREAKMTVTCPSCDRQITAEPFVPKITCPYCGEMFDAPEKIEEKENESTEK